MQKSIWELIYHFLEKLKLTDWEKVTDKVDLRH